MVERFLHTFASIGIVEHYLSGADAAVDVSLPEYA